MGDQSIHIRHDKEYLFQLLRGCLAEVRPDLENAYKPVGPSSYFGSDLNLQSIEFVRLAVSIQSKMSGVALAFQELFITADGNLVKDITVQNVVDFLFNKLTY